MTISDMIIDAHRTAIEKGWWETDRNNYELLALVHSEVSEAVEALRKGDNEHVVEELADILIRVFDLCGSRGWDLENAVSRKLQFNKTRAYRHGGKLA